MWNTNNVKIYKETNKQMEAKCKDYSSRELIHTNIIKYTKVTVSLFYYLFMTNHDIDDI